MLRWVMLLGALFWAGCEESEVRTYRIAPYLTPAYTCGECGVSLAMVAQREGGSGEHGAEYFPPTRFAVNDFTFQWGTEQLIEVDVERYEPGDVQDDPGVRYTLRRVLERREVEPDTRFEMRFPKAPPGHYPEDMIVREGSSFRVGRVVRVDCHSVELCEQLEARRPGEEEFVLELSYPNWVGSALRLHSLQTTP